MRNLSGSGHLIKIRFGNTDVHSRFIEIEYLFLAEENTLQRLYAPFVNFLLIQLLCEKNLHVIVPTKHLLCTFQCQPKIWCRLDLLFTDVATTHNSYF